MQAARPSTLRAISVLLMGTFFAQSPAQANDAPMWTGELPIRASWLRDHLPESAVVYARIPHPFGLLSMPKGNSIDAALRSASNIDNVERIRRGITENVLEQIPAFADIQLRLLEQHIRSPVEVAALFSGAPEALISVNLSFESMQTFDEALQLMGMATAEPLSSDGVGQIAAIPTPTFIRFDPSSGQLLAYSGPGANAEKFAMILEQLVAAEPHRMRAMESRIDESGHGMVLWVDAEQALPFLQLTVPPETYEQIEKSGLSEVRSVAMGFGVAGGKGRLSLVADVPTDSGRKFLPFVGNDVSARAVGDPDGLFLLSIPTVAEYSRIEALILETVEVEARADWADSKALIKDALGVSIEDILAALGPEVVTIFDAAGDYSAIRLRDAKLWDKLIKQLSRTTGVKPDTFKRDGNTYFHLSVPNEFGLLDNDALDQLGWHAILIGRQRDHLYWTRDGDHLYFASVPQILFDRASMGARTDVGRWLESTQQMDASNAFLLVSGKSQNLPARMYATYIELLLLLADIAEAEVDIWSMPSAAQLQLPVDGTLGFIVSLGDPLVAAEITFENNPFELFGNIGGIATVGILAAIAVPAYQDYQVRAQITVGLNLAGPLKTQVTEYYFEYGEFPAAQAAAAMSILQTNSEYVWSVDVTPKSGEVVIQYSESVAGGGQIWLQPTVEDDGPVAWNCSGTFAEKHLPAACRN